MKARITKRSVESVKPGDRDAFLWDTELLGFGCKVTPGGRRVYVLQYTTSRGTRRLTLGRHGQAFTADAARKEALRLKADVSRGTDPAEEKAAARNRITLEEFAAIYLDRHAQTRKKPSSVAADERNLRNHVLPSLGRLSVATITRADVARFHLELRDRPGAANRCLALLSKMFNLAELWGYRSDASNPVRHIPKYKERKLERFLSPVELARLGEVLRDAVDQKFHPSAVAAIKLLVLTGCRRDEILSLRWDDVDAEGGCLRLPDSKTGAKSVLLGSAALDLLATLKAAAGTNPFVLPGARPGRPFVGLEKAWQRIRRQAGLEDVRLHDLRHSFASFGASMGESLVILGGLLGHADASTTARYAHLFANPKRAAADRISANIAALLNGQNQTA